MGRSATSRRIEVRYYRLEMEMTGRQESGTIAAAMANAREDGSGKCKC